MLQKITDLLDETRCCKFLLGFVVFVVVVTLPVLLERDPVARS
jgi:hypothetical protein